MKVSCVFQSGTEMDTSVAFLVSSKEICEKTHWTEWGVCFPGSEKNHIAFFQSWHRVTESRERNNRKKMFSGGYLWIKAPVWRPGLWDRGWQWLTVVHFWRTLHLPCLFTPGCCLQMLSRGIYSAPGSLEKQVNNWPREGRKGGLCWCGMIHDWIPLRDEGKSRSLDTGASRTALKIKRYWLKSETVTFHWDGIYYSEKRSTKYYAVCLWGKKKKNHPVLIKTLFWAEGFDFSWWVITVFFHHFAKKWGF